MRGERRYEAPWGIPLCERLNIEVDESEVVCAEEGDGAISDWLRTGRFIYSGQPSGQPEDRLSHSILRFRTEGGGVAAVVESWAPARFISAWSLTSYGSEQILHSLAAAHGHRMGTSRREQWASLWVPDEDELALLELTAPEPVIEVVREFSNFDHQMLLAQRLLLGEGSEALVWFCDECDDEEEPLWDNGCKEGRMRPPWR